MCRHVSDGSRAIGPLRRGIFVNKIREKGLRRPLRDGARLFHRGSKRNVLTLRPRVLVLPILPQKPSPRPLSYLAQRPAPSAPPPRLLFSRRCTQLSFCPPIGHFEGSGRRGFVGELLASLFPEGRGILLLVPRLMIVGARGQNPAF